MNIIKSSEEIGRIFHEGRRITTPEICLIIQRTAQQRDLIGRVAFIAGKKQGNAVWRNRAKRRMRALYQNMSYLFESMDVLFVAKHKVNQADYKTMQHHIEQSMKTAGF